MSRVQLVYNRLPQAKTSIGKQVAAYTEKGAEQLRDFISEALDAGVFDIASDTRALAQSLYVAASGRSDYDEALAKAREAWRDNPSNYGSGARPEEAFNAIVAGQTELPEMGAHVFVCAVSTMLAYGTHHEIHERSWAQPAALAWAGGKGRAFFESLRIRQLS